MEYLHRDTFMLDICIMCCFRSISATTISTASTVDTISAVDTVRVVSSPLVFRISNTVVDVPTDYITVVDVPTDYMTNEQYAYFLFRGTWDYFTVSIFLTSMVGGLVTAP